MSLENGPCTWHLANHTLPFCVKQSCLTFLTNKIIQHGGIYFAWYRFEIVHYITPKLDNVRTLELRYCHYQYKYLLRRILVSVPLRMILAAYYIEIISHVLRTVTLEIFWTTYAYTQPYKLNNRSQHNELFFK